MTTGTADENHAQRPAAEAQETIIRLETVDGLILTLCAKDAYWCVPGAIDAVLYGFMATSFRSLEVHPAYRPLVLRLASEHFDLQYGAGYAEREDWRRLFGDDDEPEDERRPVAQQLPPVELPPFFRQRD